MRKSAYSAELVETITRGIEPLILGNVTDIDNILVLGASIDMKGMSCYNIVLDILESHGVSFTSKAFGIITDFDKVDKESNIEMVETFFDESIERVSINILENALKIWNDSSIPESMRLQISQYPRYHMVKSLLGTLDAYTKIYIVNGHKGLDEIQDSKVLDNTPLFFNKNKSYFKEESAESCGINIPLFGIYPNGFIPAADIEYNSEALSELNSITFEYRNESAPDMALDLSLPKSELKTIVGGWITNFPDRVTKILSYEQVNNLSFFTFKNTKRKISLGELISYLELQ